MACVDGALASNPTCGWAYTTSGVKVANSQGFCCQCSLSQLVGDSTTRKPSTTTQKLLHMVKLCPVQFKGRVFALLEEY